MTLPLSFILFVSFDRLRRPDRSSGQVTPAPCEPTLATMARLYSPSALRRARTALRARPDTHPRSALSPCRHPYISTMVRIGITPAALDAIVDTLPLGSVGFERDPDAKGELQIWLDGAVVVDRVAAIRPGESFSDVILRLFQSGY